MESTALAKPDAIKIMDYLIKIVQELGLNTPMGLLCVLLVGLLIIYIIKPEVMGRLRLLLIGLFVVFKWARKEKVKRKFELDITQRSKSLNKELGVDILSHEPHIKWVSETTRDTFIKNNKVVIRLDYNEDKNRTYAFASLGFVRKSLLEVSKQYVPPQIMECSSLLVTRKILENHNVDALNFLHLEILQPLFMSDSGIKEKFDELVEMDNQALFFELFLPEILEMGKQLYPRPYNMELMKFEIAGLIHFLHKLATRDYDEEVPLELSSKLFSLAIVMLAKKETLISRGLAPYKKSVEITLSQGYRNIYVLARNRTKSEALKVGKHFENHRLVDSVIYRSGKVFLSNANQPLECICILIKGTRGVDNDEAV